jgi:hypothetical protein
MVNETGKGVLENKSGLTQRAVDGGDSARFISTLLALSFSYISRRMQTLPTTTNAHR